MSLPLGYRLSKFVVSLYFNTLGDYNINVNIICLYIASIILVFHNGCILWDDYLATFASSQNAVFKPLSQWKRIFLVYVWQQCREFCYILRVFMCKWCFGSVVIASLTPSNLVNNWIGLFRVEHSRDGSFP